VQDWLVLPIPRLSFHFDINYLIPQTLIQLSFGHLPSGQLNSLFVVVLEELLPQQGLIKAVSYLELKNPQCLDHQFILLNPLVDHPDSFYP